MGDLITRRSTQSIVFVSDRFYSGVFLIGALGRLDVLPVDDFGVRKGFSLLYGRAELVKPNELRVLTETWRPYRSVGSWYMWRVLDVS